MSSSYFLLKASKSQGTPRINGGHQKLGRGKEDSSLEPSKGA